MSSPWGEGAAQKIWSAMSEPWQILMYDQQQRLVHSVELTGPGELGRQTELQEKVYSLRQVDGGWRLVIAGSSEVSISRRQVWIEPLPGGPSASPT